MDKKEIDLDRVAAEQTLFNKGYYTFNDADGVYYEFNDIIDAMIEYKATQTLKGE